MKRKFFRPSAAPRSARSTGLLSMSNCRRRDALIGVINGAPVTRDGDGRDSFGRLIACVRLKQEC